METMNYILAQAGLPITGNWTTTQKTRRICHRIIEFLVLYYSFFERSLNQSENFNFFAWEKVIGNILSLGHVFPLPLCSK